MAFLARCYPMDVYPKINLSCWEVTSIGRAEDVIIIPSSYVSRNHLDIWWDDNRWFVKDLSSLNGTYICSDEGEAFQLESFVPYEIFSGNFIGFGINPLEWIANDAHMLNEEFFVFQFIAEADNPQVVELCDSLSGVGVH